MEPYLARRDMSLFRLTRRSLTQLQMTGKTSDKNQSIRNTRGTIALGWNRVRCKERTTKCYATKPIYNLLPNLTPYSQRQTTQLIKILIMKSRLKILIKSNTSLFKHGLTTRVTLWLRPKTWQKTQLRKNEQVWRHKRLWSRWQQSLKCFKVCKVGTC